MINKYSEGKPYKVIAYVLARFSNDEQMHIIKKVARECSKYKCKVLFFSTITDLFNKDLIDDGEKKIFDLVQVERYDAIVLMSESFKQDEEQMELVKRANAANVPIFAVDKRMEGCINLVFDYKTCFREIVKHMIEYHGYRTINFMGGIPGNNYSEERLQIYKDVLEENEIPYDERRTYYGYFWEKPTIVAMDKMFEDGLSMPEAIICANDSMALAVITYLRDKGYRVPEDIAVSGFDGMELEKYSNPRLTTGVYNEEGMVCKIFEMITKEDWEDYQKTDIPIHNRMQIGHSCGCNGVEACNISDEIRKMKSQLYVLMSHYSEANQMVANYGNEEDVAKVAVEIAHYTHLLSYQDLWICFEEKLMEYLDVVNKEKWLEPNVGTDRAVGVLHYQLEDGEGYLRKLLSVCHPELLPNHEVFLEERDYCMVNILHVHGVRVGYTIVGMDVGEFNFIAYESFLNNLRNLLELQRSQRKLIHVYERDQLTNLYNRNGFYKVVNALFNTKEDLQLTIINMDMDGLKKVNDTYGHAEGDEALHSLGEILKQSVTTEVVARIGGDEFLIAFLGKDNEERVKKIKDLIIRGLDAYNQNSTKPYVLQASLGAFTDNIHEHSLDYFLKKADEQMYITKSRHKREMGDLR